MTEKKALPIVHSGHNWIPPRKVVLTGLFDKNDISLERWILFRTPWFGIQLHKISRPDAERHLHNHPRAFIAIIIKGGYEEEVLDKKPGFSPGLATTGITDF